MNFSQELIEKAKTASSAEELLEIAKSGGITISETEAAEFFNILHSKQPLSDEELSAVAGGKGGDAPDNPDPKYRVGQLVEIVGIPETVSFRAIIHSIGSYNAEQGYNYLLKDPATGNVCPFPLRLETMEVKVISG